MAKVLVVQTTKETIFKIPLHIDLEDHEQVENHNVSNDILWIYLYKGDVYKIKPHSIGADFTDEEKRDGIGWDWEIKDASDYGIDEEEYDNLDDDVTYCINLSVSKPPFPIHESNCEICNKRFMMVDRLEMCIDCWDEIGKGGIVP